MFVSTIYYVKQNGNLPNVSPSVANSQNQESVSGFNFTNNNEVLDKNNSFLYGICKVIKNKLIKNSDSNKSLNILG